VVIDFSDTIADHSADMMSNLAKAWGAIAFSGFPVTEADLLNGRASIANVEARNSDWQIFEVVVDIFDGSEAGWNPLLNTFAWVNRNMQRIISVDVR
jgi:hypothetical protein